MRYYKLGCNWGKGNPDFYDVLTKHAIVVCAEHPMEIGDIVAITKGHDVVALACITGNRIPADQRKDLEEDFQSHLIDYSDWNHVANANIWELEKKSRFKYQLQQGICQIQNSDIIETIDYLLLKINAKEMVEKAKKLLLNNHNLILTGAPGTGKTYLAKEIAESLGADWELVQFHPSYDYTDFVEGLRPIKKGNQLGFERMDGVFKKFCKKALGVSELFTLSYKELVREIKTGDISSLDTELRKTGVNSNNHIVFKSSDGRIANDEKHYVSESKLLELYLKIAENIQDFEDESRITKEKCKELNGGKEVDTTAPLILKELFKRSKKELVRLNKKPISVLIIDEINRGEVSKIFGELFYSIDPDYRGEKGKVLTQYQNLIPEDDVFYGGFFVPKNVYIIGTMNDIDRSVESMDFAMRRRFAWQEISALSRQNMLDFDDAWGDYPKPSDDIINEIKIRMNNLNSCIIDEYDNEGLSAKDKIGLTSAYQIGASYFLKYAKYNNFEDLWTNHIEGLLYEYLRGAPNMLAKLEHLKKAYNDISSH